MLFHAMSEAQVMASKLDDDDDLEERMFTDDTVKRLENLLRLAWKIFACLAFVFILSYWAIAIVHSYSSSHFFSRDNFISMEPRAPLAHTERILCSRAQFRAVEWIQTPLALFALSL